MKIQIEESALESIKRMAQQLQDERDELLRAITVIVAAHDLNDIEQSQIEYARDLIAKFTGRLWNE